MRTLIVIVMVGLLAFVGQAMAQGIITQNQTGGDNVISVQNGSPSSYIPLQVMMGMESLVSVDEHGDITCKAVGTPILTRQVFALYKALCGHPKRTWR